MSETFVVNNVVEAIKNGFQVTVITDKKNDSSFSTQEELLNDYSISEKIEKFSEHGKKSKRYFKAFCHLLNPVWFYYYIKYAQFKKKKSLSLLFRLAFYYPHRKTTFHVHFATALEPLLELRRIGFLKSKIIVTFHGYDAFYLPAGKKLESLVTDYVEYVDHITVNSAYLKQTLVLKGFPGSKINIVPIGIDPQVFKPSNTGEEIKPSFRLITVARLVDLKGIDYGIQVVKRLVDKGHNVNYSIVGEGPEEKRLKATCKVFGIETKVQFLGKKSQPQIKSLLEDHHLLFMTSTIDKDGRREAFGVVSLEAQAMGLPVVGFKSGGFPETVVDGVTGFLVDDKDIGAMAEAIEILIKDKRRLAKMGKQGRKHVLENFSFEKTTRKYLELY